MEKVTIKGMKSTSTVVKAEEEKWRNSSIYPEIMVSSRGRVREREYQHVVKDIAAGPAERFDVGIVDTDGFDAGDIHQVGYDGVSVFVDIRVDLIKIVFVHDQPPLKVHMTIVKQNVLFPFENDDKNR